MPCICLSLYKGKEEWKAKSIRSSMGSWGGLSLKIITVAEIIRTELAQRLD